MRINKSYNYWDFYFDENNNEHVYPTEEDRQCVAAKWSEEWRGLELLKMTDVELRDYLLEVVDEVWKYQFEKIDKRKIRPAINELKKIKKELGIT